MQDQEAAFMNKNVCLLVILMTVTFLCSEVLAKATNSCDGVSISFDQQAFTTQAINAGLTEAARTAKEGGGTAQEIICASLGLEGVITADIVSALRNAGFDSVIIKIAAKDTGLDMGEVNAALAPGQSTPAPLPTSVGLSPGKNATSPSVP